MVHLISVLGEVLIISHDLRMYNEARPDRDTICMEVLSVLSESLFMLGDIPSRLSIWPSIHENCLSSISSVLNFILSRSHFQRYTGHITIGGSICVKQLTRSGWDSQFKLCVWASSCFLFIHRTQFVIMIRNLITDGPFFLPPPLSFSDSQEWP